MPTPSSASHRIQATVSGPQAAAITAFQRAEGLASEREAILLLLEIALDTVTSPGRRFWDSGSAVVEAVRERRAG